MLKIRRKLYGDENLDRRSAMKDMHSTLIRRELQCKHLALASPRVK